MKKTFKELRELDVMMGELYRTDPTVRNTKFGYAYKRISDKIYFPAVKEYHADLAMVRLDHALTDPVTRAILLDNETNRGYKYDKAGMKDVIEGEYDLIGLFDKKEFEVESYAVKKEDVPPQLKLDTYADLVEALEGIMLNVK